MGAMVGISIERETATEARVMKRLENDVTREGGFNDQNSERQVFKISIQNLT